MKATITVGGCKMKQQFTRKDHVITDMAGEVVFTGKVRFGTSEYASINAAKRKSRELQGSDLGFGILRVVV